MEAGFPWYTIVEPDEDRLEQGDLLDDVDIIVSDYDTYISGSPEKFSDSLIDLQTYNVVVLTQSCDLADRQVKSALVCPYFSIDDMNKWGLAPKKAKDIRAGRMFAYHMINECELDGMRRDIQIVSFGQIFSVPLNYALSLAKQPKRRLRLRPPYREHLAQAFARFFMRVGLPNDIVLP